MLVRLAVCAGMGGARLLELVLSRRNIESQGTTREGRLSGATYPGIIGLHTAVISGTALLGKSAIGWPWLLLLLGLQPLRVAVIRALGTRWNTRGAVPESMDVVTTGPYRYVRHPNYAIVLLELLALPMAFGLRRAAMLATLVNSVLLAIRIRDEERELERVPGWKEHFGRRKRFIPGIF